MIMNALHRQILWRMLYCPPLQNTVSIAPRHAFSAIRSTPAAKTKLREPASVYDREAMPQTEDLHLF